MNSSAPTLVWLRRDLRLGDHEALSAACARGRPVIPVFIRDGHVDDLGAAPKYRLGLALEHLSDVLTTMGSRLILRSGPAQEVLESLIDETGADAVFWSRNFDPTSIERDARVKAFLKEQGVVAQSYGGQLLFEPQEVQTGQGGPYRVYTPFWKAVRSRPVATPLPPPSRITAPSGWPASDVLADWRMGAAMDRGASVLRPFVRLGEAAALQRLSEFVSGAMDRYKQCRDLPAVDGTSALSENLSLGEISSRQCWAAAQDLMYQGSVGAETFLKEIVWREFAYHLAYHTPHIMTDNWRREWDGFAWNTDPDHPDVMAWKQGRTGVPFVDAAMRELYVSGRMHNRARMVAASYLTKHLLTHWKVGLEWFADCLIDWDPASNAMGWQWVAGSGPDASPFFRVFNPETQAKNFDPKGFYAKRWIAEGQCNPPETALSFFDAVPRRWNLSPSAPYPLRPVVDLSEGRKRALSAYENRGF